MTLRSALFIGVLGIAAACGSPPAATTTAAAAPGSGQSTTVQAASGASGIETGEWHSVRTYTAVTGLPAAMIHNMTSRPHPFDGCATTSDVNAIVHDLINSDMTCAENTLHAANGTISGTAACHDDEGDTGTLSLSGTYTPTHADVNGDLSAQTSMGPVSEHIHWVGDHTAPACMHAS